MPTKLDRTTFRTSRLLDFCSRKELVAQTGHRPEAWPLVVLKELVDNAIDACEDAGIAPEIAVTVDRRGITVADNGPGIPASTIAGVLDFSIRVSNREAYVSPTRGAQGNALKTLVAMPFVLDGARGRVDIAAHGRRHEVTAEVDRIRQEPRMESRERKAASVRTGTVVTVHWPDSACSILAEAEARFLQIAEDYAWLNPHLTLGVQWHGKGCLAVKATDTAWRKWRPSDPTSPHWYRPENLERLVAAYVAEDERSGRRDRTVREFVSEFRGLSGTAKGKKILESLGLARAPLSALLTGGGTDLDRDRIADLLAAMKRESKPVKPKALGLIGRDHLEARCRAAGGHMESFEYRRVFEEVDGLPTAVETAFVWCPEAEKRAGWEKRRLVTGVNWSPGIVNPFRELGKHGEGLDAVLHEQRAGAAEPVVLLLHMACPRVEYTDRGKSAVVVEGEEGLERFTADDDFEDGEA